MKKDFPANKIKSCQPIFVFNAFVPVGLEDYVSFFKKYFKNFIYLRWRFPHGGKHGPDSCLQVYTDSVLRRKKRLFSFSLNNRLLYFFLLPLNYCVYFFQALKLHFLLNGRKPVVYMGVNYFCAFCGVVLKYLGVVDFVIYRVMDFFPLPKRGIYRYLNRVFYFLDNLCLKKCDFIWFTTDGHIKGREERGYFDRKKASYCVIPLGVDSSKFVLNRQKDGACSLLYCGMISKHHLLDLIFDCIADLKKDFPSIKLNVVGSGKDSGYFRSLASKMGLNDNIVFHGFMEDSTQFDKVIENNLLGFALYKDEEGLMKYTEPAKVKYYLNFGVPAIISRIPQIAYELEEKKVAFAVRNSKSEICECVRKFILDKDLQKTYRNNIAEYIKTVDINDLINKNLKETFNYFGINA